MGCQLSIAAFEGDPEEDSENDKCRSSSRSTSFEWSEQVQVDFDVTSRDEPQPYTVEDSAEISVYA